MKIRINNKIVIETDSLEAAVSEVREFFKEQHCDAQLTNSQYQDRMILVTNFEASAARIQAKGVGSHLETKFKNLTLAGFVAVD